MLSPLLSYWTPPYVPPPSSRSLLRSCLRSTPSLASTEVLAAPPSPLLIATAGVRHCLRWQCRVLILGRHLIVHGHGHGQYMSMSMSMLLCMCILSPVSHYGHRQHRDEGGLPPIYLCLPYLAARMDINGVMMKKFNLPPELGRRINEYHAHMFTTYGTFGNELAWMDELNSTLSSEVKSA